MPEKDKPLPVSSSEPPEFAPEQEAFFRDVLRLMNQHEVPYVVSGAFALHEHTGIWRDTKDMDLFLTAEAATQALKVLEEEGYETEITDPVWLAKAWKGEFFVDLITGMSNAVITVDQGWIDRASNAHVLEVPTRVLAAEELLASKLFVDFRERFDGADVVHIIYGTRGRLDWDRILMLVNEHWEILFWSLVLFRYVYPSESDLVPRSLWQKLLKDFQNSIASPNQRAPFRGALLDERMFAIDMKEWGLSNLANEYRRRRSGQRIRAPKLTRSKPRPQKEDVDVAA